MIGQTLAHYKILEKIGSGGMGDVYLAEDTELDRKIALKVLPPEMAASEERRARFKREAKAVAALNHPNIVHVYSVEEAEGVHFITMELVKGKTLTELLPDNGFPLNEFFEIAIPLTDAVAAAHQEGITHRDLKPDNMMLGDDGRVKVLDFGLAKETQRFFGEGADSERPTEVKTEQGAIVGTLHYMSPEQATGKEVHVRSDIFSLGVVFYEMLTGARPFTGDTPGEVLASIVKDSTPSVNDKNKDVPRELSKIVQRCLEKRPVERYQSAIDLRHDLEASNEAMKSGAEASPAVPSVARTYVRWLVAMGAISLVVAALGFGLRRGKNTDASAVPRLVNPVQLTSGVGVEDFPSWSSDGQTLAYESGLTYGASADVWVAQIAGGEPVNRTSDHDGQDRRPSWSPDGTRIAFWSSREGGGYFVMSALGGAPRKIASLLGRGRNSPMWSIDGQELAFVGRDTDGNYVEVMTWETRDTHRSTLPLDEGLSALDSSWSPDNRRLAYVAAWSETADVTRLWIAPLDGGAPIAVTDGRSIVWSPTWAPDAKKLYFVGNLGGSMDLWQQRIAANGRPMGSPERITHGIGMRRAAFSKDGTKISYSRGRRVANVWRVPILTGRMATWATNVR